MLLKIQKYKIVFRCLSLLLMVVFTCQVYSKAFYQHSHILSDGSVVTHAHPFNKSSDNSPFKRHNHASFEYYILDNANLLFAASIISLLLIHAIKKERIVFRKPPERKLFLNITTPGRSPPIA